MCADESVPVENGCVLTSQCQWEWMCADESVPVGNGCVLTSQCQWGMDVC